MNVIRYDDLNAFYARVEPYLLPREAEHNLTFGLLGTLRSDPSRFPEPLYALVEQAGEIQLVAVRTNADRALILSLAQTPEAVTALANDLFAQAIVLAGATAPVDESRAFVETWSRLSGRSYEVNVPLCTFKLERVNPVAGVPGHLRKAAAADRDLLVRWVLEFEREAFPNQNHRVDEAERSVDYRLRSDVSGFYLWDDGSTVSLAGYGGPTPHGIRVGPVYTPPEQRGHGYASACVAGMSQILLESGRQFCFLFTDRRNPTSNHIYQVIGYQAVCDFTEYVFTSG